MFRSKSSPADTEPQVTVPHGDADAARRLTGTPTGGGTATAGGTATTERPAAVAPAQAGTPGPATGTRPADPSRPAAPATKPGDAPHGKGAVKRTTTSVKQALLIVVGALAALFAVFNSQNVQVHWIFGDAVNTPLILVIAIAFLAGGLIGWIAAKLGGRNRSTSN